MKILATLPRLSSAVARKGLQIVCAVDKLNSGEFRARKRGLVGWISEGAGGEGSFGLGRQFPKVGTRCHISSVFHALETKPFICH